MPPIWPDGWSRYWDTLAKAEIETTEPRAPTTQEIAEREARTTIKNIGEGRLPGAVIDDLGRAVKDWQVGRAMRGKR